MVDIKKIPVKKLNPAPYNPRHIDEASLDGLKASIDRFGCVELIVWNKRTGNIVSGHQRFKVLQSEGVTDADVVVVDLDEGEEKALNVAMNNPHIAGDFTPDLQALLSEIQVAEPALFVDLRLDALVVQEPKAGLTDADSVPDVPEEPTCQRGQIWQLGMHRVMCGDSTDAGDVALLMDGSKATACVTDPPYAIYGSSTGVRSDASMIHPFFRALWHSIQVSGAHDVYMCCDWRSYPIIITESKAWDIKDIIVWDKGTGGLGNPYRRRHEFILFARPGASDTVMFRRGKEKERNITDDDVWQFQRDTDKQHNAAKPVEMMGRCINNSTDAGDIVFEPCGGSGSTLIACERTDRACYGMEIDPHYCDVGIKRWEDHTGYKAVLING